jgi:hypothetical protein
MKKYCLLLTYLLSMVIGKASVFALRNEPFTGSIQGTVLDRSTQSPLPMANVIVENTSFGAVTDGQGRFLIPGVPAGPYVLRFSYVGYETLRVPDVIVKSDRPASADAELQPSAVRMKGVTVRGDYFPERAEQPAGSAGFSYEEIRRAPGSAGDVSRIVMSLPSVAKVNDQTNKLIVRGGGSTENAYYVDDIEVPNINHFPSQGASGGPMGILNVDFIRDVTFLAGGFPAAYGDRLSSVLSVDFREGSRSGREGQVDLNITGFGAVGEGPMAGGKGSWMASARRSYFDWIAKVADIGSSAPPNWGDVQGKAVLDLSPGHRLTFIGITADDHNAPDREAAVEGDMLYYGSQDTRESSAGIGWRALWGGHGYSNTTLGWNRTGFREKWDETGSGIPVIRNRSTEESLRLRCRNRLILGPAVSVDFGAEAGRVSDRYRIGYGAFTDALGAASDSALVDGTYSGWKLGAFASVEASPHPLLTLTAGVRWDLFTFTGNATLSPRFSAAWRISDRTTLTASAGLYCQTLPMVLLGQNAANAGLKDPSASNAVLGFRRRLGESAQLTVEVYSKEYDRFPVDPAQLSLFLLDEQEYRYTYFTSHGPLRGDGRAFSRGLEVLLQKKMAGNYYGLIGASWFRTRYRDGFGVWRDRVLDVTGLFSAEGGYKPDRNWEFSARLILEGGAPYTPFDASASAALRRGVMDADRINASRLPAYQSLDLRIDRRFNFRESNLIGYLCVWNATNHRNVQTVFWNTVTNRQAKVYQWSLMPIVGMEYEF